MVYILQALWGGTPGNYSVIAASLLLFWPLLWFSIFRTDASASAHGVLVVAAALVASAVILTPPILRSTVYQEPTMNSGWTFIPVGLVWYGIPVAFGALLLGAIAAGVTVLATKARAGGRGDGLLARRVAILVAIGTFVPVMPFAVALAVGLGQTG